MPCVVESLAYRFVAGAVPETPGSPLGTDAPGAPPGTGWLPGVPVCPKVAGVKLPKVTSAADNNKSRNFIAKLRFSAPSGLLIRLYPWKQELFCTIS